MEPIKEPTPLVLVTSSPHMHCGLTIGKSMREVMLALVPAIIASVYYFRMSAAIVMVTCVVSAIVFETICNKVMHKPNTVQDGSAALTGLLLAMCLPASMPPLFAAMGSMFAIVVGKAVFGGLGCNILQPGPHRPCHPTSVLPAADDKLGSSGYSSCFRRSQHSHPACCHAGYGKDLAGRRCRQCGQAS